jgi:hypothetical protein
MTCTWDTESIAVLYQLDRSITQAVDFWVNTTLERYIIEFATKNHQSFSRAEADFKQDAWGRVLREIPLWIKVFLMEEGMLNISPTEMTF